MPMGLFGSKLEVTTRALRYVGFTFFFFPQLTHLSTVAHTCIRCGHPLHFSIKAPLRPMHHCPFCLGSDKLSMFLRD